MFWKMNAIESEEIIPLDSEACDNVLSSKRKSSDGSPSVEQLKNIPVQVEHSLELTQQERILLSVL